MDQLPTLPKTPPKKEGRFTRKGRKYTLSKEDVELPPIKKQRPSTKTARLFEWTPVGAQVDSEQIEKDRTLAKTLEEMEEFRIRKEKTERLKENLKSLVLQKKEEETQIKTDEAIARVLQEEASGKKGKKEKKGKQSYKRQRVRKTRKHQ